MHNYVLNAFRCCCQENENDYYSNYNHYYYHISTALMYIERMYVLAYYIYINVYVLYMISGVYIYLYQSPTPPLYIYDSVRSCCWRAPAVDAVVPTLDIYIWKSNTKYTINITPFIYKRTHVHMHKLNNVRTYAHMYFVRSILSQSYICDCGCQSGIRQSVIFFRVYRLYEVYIFVH